jgi:DNA-binding PadR family transcriptional regulator
MLAILRQHPSAYGVSIQEQIEEQTKHRYSFGSIYAALERLDDRGYVKSREGEATSQRGGRKKVYFALTGLGQAALQESLAAVDALRKGLRWREATA